MEGCVFCKIVRGELPAFKVYEDEEFLAFLDINPNTEGMTVLTTKTHYPSYAFDLPADVYSRLMEAARKVAKLLDEKLPVQRTALVMEGMGVDHVHLKLYPLHGLDQKFQAGLPATPAACAGGRAAERTFFKNYPGYITTQLGPKAENEKLAALAKKIGGG